MPLESVQQAVENRVAHFLLGALLNFAARPVLQQLIDVEADVHVG